MAEPPQPIARFHLPIAAGAARAARQLLIDWLRTRAWPGRNIDDLALAVHEAVANAVEHAYQVSGMESRPAGPGSNLADDFGPSIDLDLSEVTGPSGHRRVNVVVTDHGRWKHPTAPGDRGRGLRLIRALTETTQIDHAHGGTRLCMVSFPVDPVSAIVPTG
ncbi:MAG TPA: ATP-binding protein [Pseudonocardia sp.]|jgi:anti-sigma regulatory factor (Ser/Thr protein kinase)|nr:ATP-binding protein [Pseudonocardia sp.]